MARTAAYCHAQGIALIVRGGGTSMAGNAIGRGVVIDLSRHMHHVRAVDAEAGTAIAESGIVLTTLAAHARTVTDGRPVVGVAGHARRRHRQRRLRQSLGAARPHH